MDQSLIAPISRKRSTYTLRIVLLLCALLWALGFSDLLRHTSRDLQLFGRYSYGFFAGMLLYAASIPLLFAAAGHSKTPERIQNILRRIQQSNLLGAVALMLLVGVGWAFWTFHRFEGYRVVQLNLVLYTILLGASLVLYEWRQGVALWRKLALGLVIGLVAIEVVLQLLASAGRLPSGTQLTAGRWVPYGRVYNSAEGYSNTVTNRYGYHYPEFGRKTNQPRTIIIGDGFVEATQVAPDENFAYQLRDLTDRDVLAMGASGYGPAQYLEMAKVAVERFAPDEIVIAINPSDDFLNLLPAKDPRYADEHSFYVFAEDGTWNLAPASYQSHHILDHYLTDTNRPIYETALRTISSHALTLQLGQSLLSRPDEFAWLQSEISAENWHTIDADFAARRFAYEPAGNPEMTQAVELMTGMLELTTLFANETTVKLVVLPTHSDASGIDLQHPEQILTQFAADKGIEIVPLMQMLDAENIAVEGLFFPQGVSSPGHLNLQGHQTVAELINRCLYQNECK